MNPLSPHPREERRWRKGFTQEGDEPNEWRRSIATAGGPPPFHPSTQVLTVVFFQSFHSFSQEFGLHKLPPIALQHGQTKIETTVDTLRVMQMSPKGDCGVLLEPTLFLFLFTFLCHLWFANDGRLVLWMPTLQKNPLSEQWSLGRPGRASWVESMAII